MKIKKEDLPQLCKILQKLNCNFTDMSLFFPIEMKETYVDEFGMPTTKYKAETFYGNQLLAGVLHVTLNDVDEEDTVSEETLALLGYAPTTEIYSFNLAGYLDIIPQVELSSDDKKYLLQFESCLVKTEKVSLNNCDLNLIYNIDSKDKKEFINLKENDDDNYPIA